LPHTFIITSQRTFEVHSKNNVSHSTSQKQRQSQCNGSQVILLEIFEQSCTLRCKTCQEDRQAHILEVAQGHPLLHFEDCHLVAVPQNIVSRTTFRRDKEEVLFNHHSRIYSYKRTVKTVEINIKSKKQNILISFHRHFLRIITHKSDTMYLTLRRLMSHIYKAPILDVSRSHTTTQHSR